MLLWWQSRQGGLGRLTCLIALLRPQELRPPQGKLLEEGRWFGVVVELEVVDALVFPELVEDGSAGGAVVGRPRALPVRRMRVIMRRTLGTVTRKTGTTTKRKASSTRRKRSKAMSR